MLQEFKKFIARGNVIDLAVGVVVGAAFTAIVNSMVNDLLNPVLGVLAGNLDFSEYFVALDGHAYATVAEAETAGAPILKYGLFLNAVIKFFIVAFVVFLLVRQINRIKAQFEAKAADPSNTEVPTPADIVLLTEIRDALVAKNIPGDAPPPRV